MLYYPDTFKAVTQVPHRTDFDRWVSGLSNAEMQAIQDTLNAKIDADLEAGKEVQVAGWIPGSDWKGTAYLPIYEKACRYNQRASALCFGLIVWKVFMDRPDDWSFVADATKKDGTPIQSKVYFPVVIQ